MKYFIKKYYFIAFVIIITACGPENVTPVFYDEELEYEVFEMLNSKRADKNLPILQLNEVARREARTYSKDVKDGVHSIYNLDGFDHTEKIMKKVYPDAEINVLFMHGNGDAEFPFDFWMLSESAVAIIEGDYNYAGVGAVPNNEEIYYYTIIFMKLNE